MTYMKRNITFLLLVTCLALTTAAQKSARELLDQTAAAFEKAGSVESRFSIRVFSVGSAQGESAGVIRLQGEKFKIETPDAVTWFDGETQWTYLADSEDVNITNPTEEELQEINPYALLNLYRKGYAAKQGKTKTWANKPVTEVVLTANDRKRNMQTIRLYINKELQPVYVEVTLRDGSRNEINMTEYKTGEKYEDELFVFDEKEYPEAEVVDLRE